MKHASLFFGLIVALGLLMSNCKPSQEPTSVFAEAESLMYTHPDSALHLLQAIPNPEQLTGQAQADYALLMTQAKFRNHLSPTSDSLIRIAVEYYKNSDEIERKAKSLLYWAGVYMETEQYSKAVYPLREAEKLLNEIEKPYIQTQILSSLSYLNRIAENYDTALTYYKKALHIHLQHDHYEWHIGKLSDAQALSYQAFTDSAITYMQQLKKAAIFDFFTHYESKQITENLHQYDQETILTKKNETENQLYHLLASCLFLTGLVITVIWHQKKKGQKQLQELQTQIGKITRSAEIDKGEISKLQALLVQSKLIKQEYDQIMQLATKQDIEALSVYLRLQQAPYIYSIHTDLPGLMHWLNRTSNHFAYRLRDRYPRLTSTEINTCCLQRLGFSHEKMATIMQVKTTSINQNIYRSCSKLGIESDKHKFKNYITSF